MRILSFNNVISTVSQVNEKVVQALSEQHKKIAMIVAAAISLLVVLAGGYFARNCIKARSLGKGAESIQQEAAKLTKEGKADEGTKKLEEAAKKIEDALTYRPNHVNNLVVSGNIFRDQNKLEDCEKQYKKALEIEQKNPKALKASAEFAVSQNKNDVAEKHYEVYVSVAADDYQAWGEYEKVLRAAGKTEDADKAKTKFEEGKKKADDAEKAKADKEKTAETPAVENK